MKRLVYRLEPMAPQEEGLIKAAEWNALVRFLRRNQLRHAVWMEEAGAGHDWETSVSLREGAWVATVRPGFVNGRAPVVLSSGALVSLLDGPELPVVGLAAMPHGEIPQWFRDRWTFEAPPKLRPTEEGGLQRIIDPAEIAAAAEAGGYRRLWSTGVWLRVARPRLILEAMGSRLLLNVAPEVAADPRVYVGRGPESEAVSEGTVLDGFRDDGWEFVRLATIYLLSPPGTTETAEPDETWAPYVEHHEFYSLAARSFPPEIADGGIDTGIPFTLRGSEILIALGEDRVRRVSEIAALASANRVRHEFWSV